MRQEPYVVLSMVADEVTSYSTPAFKENAVRRMRGVRGYPYRDFDYDIIV